MHVLKFVWTTLKNELLISYQTDRMRKAVLQAVILQELPKVRYIAGGESQRVQFGQFGVRWDPGQTGF